MSAHIQEEQAMKSSEEKIKDKLGNDFISAIRKLHNEENKSILKISKMCDVSRDTIYKLCKKHDIKTNTCKEAATVRDDNKGEKHWAYGKKRPDASERMKRNNPANNNQSLIKMAISKANFLKNNTLPKEQEVIDILDKLGIKYIFQHPFNRYVIDFFFPSCNLCIEVESMDKWGKTKRERAATKRAFLEKNELKVENVPRMKICEELILNILHTYNII